MQLLHIHLIDLNVSIHLKARRSRKDSETHVNCLLIFKAYARATL